MLRYILLGFLEDQPATGYDIKQALEGSTTYYWHAYQSQIYTTLRKLEELGLISSHVEVNNDHFVRRVYMITPDGKKDLQAWLNEPMTELPKMKEDLLVRLFHSRSRDIAEVLAELRLQRKLHHQQLAALLGTKPLISYSQGHNGGQSDCMLQITFQTATIRFGISYEQMYIQWLDELIEELEAIN
jgi:PadR family transcriptional regulator AphA